MQHLGNILKNFEPQSPLRKSITSAIVVEKATEVLQFLFGAEIHNLATVVSFKDGTLAIKCRTTSATSALKARENELFSELSTRLGQQIVRRIVYVI